MGNWRYCALVTLDKPVFLASFRREEKAVWRKFICEGIGSSPEVKFLFIDFPSPSCKPDVGLCGYPCIAVWNSFFCSFGTCVLGYLVFVSMLPSITAIDFLLQPVVKPLCSRACHSQHWDVIVPCINVGFWWLTNSTFCAVWLTTAIGTSMALGSTCCITCPCYSLWLKFATKLECNPICFTLPTTHSLSAAMASFLMLFNARSLISGRTCL